ATSSTAQYYRVKRHTQTIFINTSNPNGDTVLALKHRIIKALSSTAKNRKDGLSSSITSSSSSSSSSSSPPPVPTTPSEIQLQIQNKKDPCLYQELMDSKTLAVSGLVDQQVIVMTFKTASGAWEDVHIVEPETVATLDDLEDEPEEIEAPRSPK
ncbi:hypothetical protein BGZ65_012574, partial [Modicella reniformis]